MQQKKLLLSAKNILITIFLTLGLSISFQSLLADWVAPTDTPPDQDDIYAPLNIGGYDQIKTGGLKIGSTAITDQNGDLIADDGFVSNSTSLFTSTADFKGNTNTTAINLAAHSSLEYYPINSDKGIRLKLDADQATNANISFFQITNPGDTNVFTVSEAGNTTLNGTLSFYNATPRVNSNDSVQFKLDNNESSAANNSSFYVNNGSDKTVFKIEETGQMTLADASGVEKFRVDNTGTLQSGSIPVARITGLSIPTLPTGTNDVTLRYNGTTGEWEETDKLQIKSDGDLEFADDILNLTQDGSDHYYINSDKGIQLKLDNDGGDSSSFQINNSGNKTVFKIEETGQMTLSDTDGDSIFVVNSAGNITKVNAISAASLTTTGAVSAGSITTGGSITATGNITAASFIYTSDQRLKKNVVFLDQKTELEKILDLNAVQFKWRQGDDGKNLGFIAQEVEKIYPELVETNESGIKGVNYAGLVAPLVSAIKEQQAEIDALRAELDKTIQK